MWIVAWSPYSVVSLIGISGHADLLTPLSSMLPALFAKSAACIDPFIYSLNHPKIRHEIIRRLYNISVAWMNERQAANSSLASSAHDFTTRNLRSNSRINVEHRPFSQSPCHHHGVNYGSQPHGRIGSLVNSAFRIENSKNICLDEERKRLNLNCQRVNDCQFGIEVEAVELVEIPVQKNQ